MLLEIRVKKKRIFCLSCVVYNGPQNSNWLLGNKIALPLLNPVGPGVSITISRSFLYESLYKLCNYFHSLLWVGSGH